jgi:hypothetical protein
VRLCAEQIVSIFAKSGRRSIPDRIRNPVKLQYPEDFRGRNSGRNGVGEVPRNSVHDGILDRT